MGRYKLNVPDGVNEFEHAGTTFDGGSIYETDNPCDALSFYNAARSENPELGRADVTEGFWQSVDDACQAQTAAPPRPSAATTTPGANPVTPGGDRADQQGAPPPPDSGTVNGQRTPSTDSVVADTEEQPRPDAGERHPTHSDEQTDEQTDAGDPVDIFNGALYLSETDLEIPNSILPLHFSRFYRSGVATYGPLGWGWDHNHNFFIRELKTGDVALWRSLREEIFKFDGEGFEPPTGRFEKLVRLTDGVQVFDLFGAGGLTLHFERPAGWIDVERIPLVWIADRHGNRLTYSYGTNDTLVEVRNEENRFLQFEYNQCGLMSAVTDHAGRKYSYGYNDEIQHLVCTSSPATADHADGISRIFHYDKPYFPARLRHNIVRIEDSNSNIYLENKYEQDPAAWHYGRITEQLYGGFLYQFRYTQLQWVPANSLYSNIAAVRVEVLTPDFGLETYTFNYRGNLLDRRYRLVKDKSFRVVAWQYQFDVQANLSVLTKPDGGQIINTYDFDNSNPRMRGNLLQKEMRAAAGFPSPSRIIWRAKYEPVYQLMVEEKNETGSTTQYKYDFNINPVDPANSGRLSEVHYPGVTLPDGTVQNSIVRYEHNSKGQRTAVVQPDGTRYEMHYGNSADNNNRLVKKVFDVTGLNIEIQFNYNAFGFEDESISANGNVTKRTINSLGQVEKVILPAVASGSAEFRYHYNNDKKLISFERPKGQYADATLVDNTIVDQFERNILGYPEKYLLSSNTDNKKNIEVCSDYRGLPVETLNPDGSKVKRVYDERGISIREDVSGLDSSFITSKKVYNKTGKLVQETHSTGQTVKYRYDGFERLHSISLSNNSELKYTWLKGDLLESLEIIGDDGHGGNRTLTLSSYAYDARGRKVRETVKSFKDNPAVFDEVSSTFYYDKMDRIEKIVDNRGGISTFGYDGVGRVIKKVDPLGNEEHYSYDNNGNTLQQKSHHIEPDGSVSILEKNFAYDQRNRLIKNIEPDGAEFSFEYDDRNLLISRKDYSGVITEIKHDSFGNKLEEIYDPTGLNIVHKWILDSMSRITSYIDPKSEVSHYYFDGIGRLYKTEYPNGFSSTRLFNEQGLVVEETLNTGVKFEFGYDVASRLVSIKNTNVPASIVPVQTHHFAYDGLDRLVTAKVGGNEIVRQYDSMSRLLSEQTLSNTMQCRYSDAFGDIEKEWPDGRTEKQVYDLNGALIQIKEMTNGSLGEGPGLIADIKPSGQSYPGEISYRGELNVVNAYDERKRLTEMAISSSVGVDEKIKYRYDIANRKRVESISGTNPALNFYTFDNKYRLTKTKDDFISSITDAITQAEHDAAITVVQTASAAATHQQEFEYNQTDDRIKFSESGKPTKNYTYLAGHRIQSDGTNTYTHHANGSLKSDGLFSFEVDALGRIIEAKSGTSSVFKLEYDALGRPSIIKEAGKPVRSFNYLGAFVEQENENGIASRQITTHPVSGLPLAYHAAPASYFPLFDNRYNLIGLCDTSGNVIERYRYKPFGSPEIFDATGNKIAVSAFGVEPVFGGQRYLSSNGLYLSKRRLMNPENGLFLSADSLGYVNSPSLYVYVGQNPIDLIDPDGEFAFLAGLLIAAIVGAVVSGGINAVRQGIAISEGSQEGWDWGQFGVSVGIGAVAGPLLVVAPELAIPLAAYGVGNGIAGIAQGNYATGAFDIATSLVPFGFKGVRTSTFGRGSLVGQARGMGPAIPWSTRVGRFPLIGNAARNFLPPVLGGRRVGIGFSRGLPPGDAEGHVAVVLEDPESGFIFFEKNAQRAPDRSLIASFNQETGLPDIYVAAIRQGVRPFEYSYIRVSARNAARAMEYASDRTNGTLPEPFDFDCANCSHFAADVLAEAGFRNFGNGRGSGVHNNFVNYSIARMMAYAGGLLSNGVHPNETTSSK